MMDISCWFLTNMGTNTRHVDIISHELLQHSASWVAYNCRTWCWSAGSPSEDPSPTLGTTLKALSCPIGAGLLLVHANGLQLLPSFPLLFPISGCWSSSTAEQREFVQLPHLTLFTLSASLLQIPWLQVSIRHITHVVAHYSHIISRLKILKKNSLKSILLMLKLAQTILTELIKQIIAQAVIPAYCRERKPLTCQGKELAGGSDSQVKRSVFLWSSAIGSTISTGTAQCMGLGCLLQFPAQQCAL